MPKNKQKVTVQGFGSPVPVGDASVGVGSARPSSSDYSNPIETVDAFAKKDRMARTPPRARTLSLPCVEFGEDIHNEGSKKRRRNEEKQIDKTSEHNIEEKSFKEILCEMATQIRHLEYILRDAYKPKTEICEISSTLSVFIEKLCPERLSHKEITDWIETKKEDDAINYWREKITIEHQMEQDKLRKENEQLRQQIQAMDMEKCIECTKVKQRNIRIQKLKTSDSYGNFLTITEDEWKDEILNKRTTKQGNVWETPTDSDILLPCNRNFASKYSGVNKAINYYGGREGLSKQNKNVGEVALMAHSIGFLDSDGNLSQNTRWIYYPILGEKVNESDSSDRELFQALQDIKARMIEKKRTKLVIPELEDVSGHIILRMLEFLFIDTDVQIMVCKPYQKMGRRNQENNEAQHIRKGQNTQTQTKKEKPKLDTIIVHMKDKTYADLLKTVKSAVNPSEVGVEIGTMKSTKKGELLLIVENGADKAEVLKRELIEKVPGASASILLSKKVVHIKDMDEVTNKSEIVEAISRAAGAKREDFEVRAIRPAYGNKQNATIIMKDDDANRLIQTGRVKIGWTYCRILERKIDPRCYRCWEHGHLKAQCNGPNREGLCLKCVKAGHTANQCKNEAFCVICQKEGHQSYSRKCDNIRGTKNAYPTNQHK